MAIGRARNRRHAGRYELFLELAQSYMGPLWLARVGSGPGAGTIALLREVGAGDAASAEKLRRAAARSLEVDAPHTARAVEILNETTSIGVVYDYVEGDTLRAVQGFSTVRRKPIPLGVALRVIADLLSAVAATHKGPAPSFGGLSPDSVLLGTDGQVLLLDHGLSSEVSASNTHGQHPERVAYAAPEQVDGKGSVDARSDVFTAGVLLWEMLSNRRLFIGSDSAVAQKVLAAKIPRLDDVKRRGDFDIPGKVVDVVARALERDPKSRHQSVDAMLAELSAVTRVADSSEVGAFITLVAEGTLERRREAIKDETGGKPVVALSSVLKSAPNAPALQQSAQPANAVPGAAPFGARKFNKTQLGMPAAPARPQVRVGGTARGQMPTPKAGERAPQTREKPAAAEPALPDDSVITAKIAAAAPAARAAPAPDPLPPQRPRMQTMMGMAPVPPLPPLPAPQAETPKGTEATAPAAAVRAAPLEPELNSSDDEETIRAPLEKLLRGHYNPAAPVPQTPGPPPEAFRAALTREVDTLDPDSESPPLGAVAKIEAESSSPSAPMVEAEPSPVGVAAQAAPREEWDDGIGKIASSRLPNNRPPREFTSPSASPSSSPSMGPGSSPAPSPSLAPSRGSEGPTSGKRAPTGASVPPPAMFPSKIPPPLIHDPRANFRSAAPARRQQTGLIPRKVAFAIVASVAIVGMGVVLGLYVVKRQRAEAAAAAAAASAKEAEAARSVPTVEPPPQPAETAAPTPSDVAPTPAPSDMAPAPAPSSSAAPAASDVAAAPMPSDVAAAPAPSTEPVAGKSKPASTATSAGAPAPRPVIAPPRPRKTKKSYVPDDI